MCGTSGALGLFSQVDPAFVDCTDSGNVPSRRRFVIEQSKDADDHGTTQLVICKEHFPVFLRLVLRIGFCMRPTDNPPMVPVQVHMQAKNDLITPTRKRNTVLRKILWESNRLGCGWTNMRGAL